MSVVKNVDLEAMPMLIFLNDDDDDEDRVRKIRYGRIWFQLTLSLSIPL